MGIKTRAGHFWLATKRMFFDYADHSTIHGINYIAERNRSWIERVWWIVAFCVSVICCGKLIFDAWHINPIIISFTSKPTAIWQIPFPAITICPTIPTELQNLRNIIEKYNRRGIPFNKVTEEEKQQLLALNAFCSISINFEGKTNGTNCNGCLKTLRQIAIPMEEIFFECKFKGQVINCSDVFKKVGLNLGLCYTFNGLDVHRKGMESSGLNEWTMEQGYAPFASLDTYPFRATGAGTRFGLSIVLRYKTTSLDNLCRAEPGFLLDYRMPNEVSRFSSEFFMVVMQQSMTFIVDPKLMVTSKALRGYSVAEKKCYFSDERRLKYFVEYTQPNCEAECEVDNVLDKCGCLVLFIEDRHDFDTCGIHDVTCMNNAEEEIRMSNYKTCNCLPACSSIVYESEIHVNELNMSDLRRTHDINKKDYIYTELSFYFKANQFLTSQRTERYGTTDFLATCGGLLGLFLGVSIISLLEIVFFTTSCRKKTETRVKVDYIFRQFHGSLKILKDLIVEYSEKTTIHGIKYVANAKLSRPERFWWTIAVMILVSCCGFMISEVFWRNQNYPVTINFAEEETSIQDIPFPAVTVCPQASASHMEEIFNYFVIQNKSLYHLAQYLIDAMTALAQVCDPDVFGSIDPLNKTNCEGCSQYLSDMLGKEKYLFSECQYINSNETCHDIFKKFMTEQGICFTFNGLDVYRTNNTFEPPARWTLEGGYKDSLPNGIPKPGSNFPLWAVMSMYKTMNERICKGPIQGFKLFLHLPNEAPRISKHFYLLPYGVVTQISLNTKMITTAPELRDLAVEKRQCYFSDERRLRFFRDYTQNNCESECVANMTMERCGCLRFHMPKVAGVKYCGISEIQCYQLILQQNGRSFDCNCLPSCTSISYDTEISQYSGSILVQKYSSLYLDDFSLAALYVTFKGNQFVAQQRSLLYGTTEFLASCGGLLALFLGFSFMSVVELIYFCTIRLVCNVKNNLVKK